jgi:hypothetical protein
MESPHPEERPLKKRRFFTEDSSPAQPRSKRLSPRSQTPPPIVDNHAQVQVEDSGVENERAMDGFDVGMLQAVVGELSLPTLQKLKDVSGNNVERGMHRTRDARVLALTLDSNQLVSRWLVELCTGACDCINLSKAHADAAHHGEHSQAHRVRSVECVYPRIRDFNASYPTRNATKAIHRLVWGYWLGHKEWLRHAEAQ